MLPPATLPASALLDPLVAAVWEEQSGGSQYAVERWSDAAFVHSSCAAAGQKAAKV